MTTPFLSLLQAARGGDNHALGELLSHVERRLKAYARSRLGPRMKEQLRTSDVLQNAYVEMLRALPTFAGDSEEDFVAWVTQIIENDIRRQQRWFGAAKRTRPERTSARNALAKVLLDEPPTPSSELIADEELELLDRALQELPDDYREVIELAIRQELSHREVAAHMGRTEAATRMLLSRARAALSQAIERLDGA